MIATDIYRIDLKFPQHNGKVNILGRTLLVSSLIIV